MSFVLISNADPRQ